QKARKADGRDLALAHVGFAAFLLDQARVADALGQWAEAERLLSAYPDQRDTLRSARKFQQGVMLRPVSASASEAALRDSLAIARDQMGPDHVYTALVRHELAMTLVAADKLKEADAELNLVLDVAWKRTGLAHPRALVAVVNAAQLRAKL